MSPNAPRGLPGTERFVAELEELRPPASAAASWHYVPYDQLHVDLLPEPDESLGVVLIESTWKASQRPYHQQKLAYVLANQRHFALELARAGLEIDYRFTSRPYDAVLEELARARGPISVNEPAERELRVQLAPLVKDGLLTPRPPAGWLTTEEDFAELGDPPWRMDAFYRHVRRRTGYLMEKGKPVGGKFSFDAENRQPWKGDPPAPEPPTFEADPITQEVGGLIRERFGHHPGSLDLAHLPAKRADAQALLRWALESCLEHFGPYEDAMSIRSSGLFHTRLSPLLNLHRLLPIEVVDEVLSSSVPLPSKEGFLRQVIGWREFVRHVHRATDGFRELPEHTVEALSGPGDGGWKHAIGKDWTPSEPITSGGAQPSHLGASRSLPPAFWGEQPSGLACLDRVVSEVWRGGWSHHITRLMVLSNVATLLDVSPRQLTDWFWIAYVDAYDWVVEPNVLAMGTFAAGELMTTKPYVSGAAYLDRLSDYCGECAFDPKRDCPVTRLYWAFLNRHREALAGNPRLALQLKNAQRRSLAQQEKDAVTFEKVAEALSAGEELEPASLPEAKR